MTLATCLGMCAPPFWIAGFLYRANGPKTEYGCGIVGWSLMLISSVLTGDLIYASICGLAIAYCVWQWWRNGGGKDLKKAARELGDESRQRVQALVNALQPQPAGA